MTASRYTGVIKVVGEDSTAFPVDPATLKALGTSCYDTCPREPYGAVEVISAGEWNRRADARRDRWFRLPRDVTVSVI